MQNCWEQKEKKSNNNNNLVKARGMHEAITFLVTNQILVSALVPHRTKEKREEKQKREMPEHPKAKFPPKSNFLKSPIDPWLCILALIW